MCKVNYDDGVVIVKIEKLIWLVEHSKSGEDKIAFLGSTGRDGNLITLYLLILQLVQEVEWQISTIHLISAAFLWFWNVVVLSKFISIVT